MSKKDILLVGYGSVGAVYTLILTRGGRANVTVVARSNFEAVQKSGMNIDSDQFGKVSHFRPYRVVKSIQDALDRLYAYVFLVTKAVPDVIKTSTILAPILEHQHSKYRQQPTYVILQNGLNVEADLYDALRSLDPGKAPRIVGSAVAIATVIVDNTTVRHGDFTRLTIGIYRRDDYVTSTDTPSESVLLSELVAVLEGASPPKEDEGLGTGPNSKVITTAHIFRAKFIKNLWNVTFASFAALSRYPSSAIFRPPPDKGKGEQWSPYLDPRTKALVEAHTIPAIRATLVEAVSIARALGWPDAPESEGGVPSSVIDSFLERERKYASDPGSWHHPSMLADIEAGECDHERGPRPIEVEVIVGEPVRLARKYGVAVPHLDMLYALLLVVQNQILRRIEEGKA